MSDPHEETEVATVKALTNYKKDQSITKSMDKARGRPRGTAMMDLPPVERFKKVLKKAGVTEKTLADTLADLLTATKETIDRTGKIHITSDNNIRLKTVELLLKYYAPEQKENQNHLHLHGKKLDELLGR